MPCCVWGCHNGVDVLIDHSDHGQRAVCDEHVAGHDVIQVVGA